MPSREFEDFRRQLQALPLRRILRIALIVIAVIVALSAPATMFYTVEAEGEAVVLRFGRFQSIESPGLHWKLPYGIDSAEFVPTRLIKKAEFGFRTLQPGKRTVYARGDFNDVSLMLTGDLNIAEVKWIVQYRIRDPRQYLFSVRNPDETLYDVAESAMRLVVGDISITDVLTEKRGYIEREAQTKIQEMLDAYRAGIQVVTVKLQDVSPPATVKASYDEVNEARLQKETTINGARQEYLREIPEARGQGQQKMAEAEGLKVKRTMEAEGDVAKFEALLAEYERAPEVTRARLYLEALAKVLPRIRSIYIVDEAAGGPVQVLDLDRAAARPLRPKAATTRESAATRTTPRSPRASQRRRP